MEKTISKSLQMAIDNCRNLYYNKKENNNKNFDIEYDFSERRKKVEELIEVLFDNWEIMKEFAGYLPYEIVMRDIDKFRINVSIYLDQGRQSTYKIIISKVNNEKELSIKYSDGYQISIDPNVLYVGDCKFNATSKVIGYDILEFEKTMRNIEEFFTKFTCKLDEIITEMFTKIKNIIDKRIDSIKKYEEMRTPQIEKVVVME